MPLTKFGNYSNPINPRMDKLGYNHTLEYGPAMILTELQLHVTSWLNLTSNNVERKKPDIWKNTYSMMPCIQNMKTGKTSIWLDYPLGKDSDWKGAWGAFCNMAIFYFLILVLSLCSLCENGTYCTLNICMYCIVQFFKLLFKMV